MRRLTHTVESLQGCLAYLPQTQRRLLGLRGGLAGGGQVSLHRAAQLLGLSVVRARGLESSALRGLRSEASTKGCGGSTAVAGAISVAVGGSASSGFASSGLAGSAFGSEAPSSPAGRRAPESNGGDTSGGNRGVLSAFASDAGEDSAAGERALDLLLFLFVVTTLLFGAVAGTRQLAAVAPRRRTGGKPVLFLDVDGVIALDGPTDETFERPFLLGPGLIYIRQGTGARLRRLGQRFELVWATGWGSHANDELPLILGLPDELPALTFGRRARYGSSEWKLAEMDRYARHRPAAWVDDHMGSQQEAWADGRRAPTLLVETDAAEGLMDEHVERLLAWADAISQPDDTGARAPAQPIPHPQRPA
jgi:hypothetical protein